MSCKQTVTLVQLWGPSLSLSPPSGLSGKSGGRNLSVYTTAACRHTSTFPSPVPALPCPPLLLQVENAETTLPGTQHSVSPLENPKSSFIDWLAEKTSQSKTLKALMVQAVALILAKSGVKLRSLTLFVLILGYIYNLCNFSNFIYKMGIIIVHTS